MRNYIARLAVASGKPRMISQRGPKTARVEPLEPKHAVPATMILHRMRNLSISDSYTNTSMTINTLIIYD